ncbi:MAG: hypothetical protein ACE5I1_07855 [bacterium]
MEKRKCFALVSMASVLFLTGCNGEKIAGSDSGNHQNVQIIANKINADFHRIRELSQAFAHYTREIYENQGRLKTGYTRSKYTTTSKGLTFKQADDGGSAFISTGIAKNGTTKKKAQFTEFLDLFMIPAANTYREIAQIYFNDAESIARIYPYFDIANMFDPGTDVRKFNFYFLADEQHNPQKKSVWVDAPYVDPAGRGWMISAITPVFFDKKLTGVSGIDVTLHTITQRYLQDAKQLYLLVASNGVVVATDETAAQILELPPLVDHKYIETIKSNTFRSEAFNLLQSTSKTIRGVAERIINEKLQAVELTKKDNNYIVRAAPLSELGWSLWQIMPH